MTVAVSDRPIHRQAEDLSAADFRACAETSGEAADRPLGIACVLALRTIVGSGILPPNAIMLGYRATWHEEPRLGRYVTEMSVIEADLPRTRYQRVVIGYRTTAADGRLAIEQEQEVLWPVTV